MDTVQPQTASRFELSTDWAGYQKILEVVGERRIHVTYDRGRLELLSPGKSHESRKTLLGAIIECVMTELKLDFAPGGGMTFQRQDLDRGFEPDECYWISTFAAVHGKSEWESASDPPPDLAIEVEITSSALNRLDLYHTLGVGELWRLTKQGEVIILQRGANGYINVQNSPRFPFLSARLLTEWMAKDLSQTRLIHQVRAELPALIGPPD